MLDIKKEISEQIAKTIENVEAKEIYTYIEVPKDTKNGDYSFPCFRLAKVLRKAPQEIANQIKEKLEQNGETNSELIEKVDNSLEPYIPSSIIYEARVEKRLSAFCKLLSFAISIGIPTLPVLKIVLFLYLKTLGV